MGTTTMLSDRDIQRRGAEVAVISGQARVESAHETPSMGVNDYLVRPVDRSPLKSVLAHVSGTRALEHGVVDPCGEMRGLGQFGAMVGRSKAMQAVYDVIERVAANDASVMITGESGTGKELVAQTIHQLSDRRNKLLLCLNCGAVSPALIESELFGHERGSFTGADRFHMGYFERTDGGTLLLDEVTEMPIELQVTLLRVLETGVLWRVGGTESVRVNVRIISTSNCEVTEAVKQGKLREDLFYRLNVFPIQLPPLRERGDDLELLAQHFLDELNRATGKTKSLTRVALEQLRTLRLTGNVRELRNLVHRAFILADEEIGVDSIAPGESVQETGSAPVLHVRLGSSIAAMEQLLIAATLLHVEGDKRKAARILGISLKTLYNRLNVYSAGHPGFRVAVAGGV